MAWTPKDSNLYQNDGFMYQSPFNAGIGDWFSNMNKWKAMNGPGESQHIGQGGAADIMARNENGVGAALGSAWMDGGNPHGQYNQQLYDAMKGYTYKGEDGKQYMINGNYYHGGGLDQEGAHTAGDLAFGGVGALGHADKGRQLGEMAYSVGGFDPNWGGDLGAYNGMGFDNYDKDGKYVGSNIPLNAGDDSFAKHAAMVAAMVFGGAALAGLAPAAAGSVGGGMSLGEGALAASGNFGLNAGTMGAAAANAGAVGGAAAGLGSVGSEAGGHGAFVGEGAWTPTAGGGGMPGGFGGGLTGVPPPANPAAGGGLFGGGGGSGGGFLNQELFSIPGLGGVSGQNLLGLGSSLVGAIGGGQGQEQSQTQTRELPEWLQGPVAGGLIPQTNWLMNQQMNVPSTGLLSTSKSKSKKKKSKTGLLSKD